MEQLQRLLLQLIQLQPILSAQRQLLVHVQLLGAVVQQRRHTGLRFIRAVLLRQFHRRGLCPQHMGHSLGLEIAHGDGPQRIRRQMFQVGGRAVKMLPLDVAPHGGRDETATPSFRQRGTDIGGGQLDQLRVLQKGDLCLIPLLQSLLLPLHGGADILLHPAERRNTCNAANDLRFMPCVKGQEHIRSHQQPQFCIGILLLQLHKSIAGIAFAGAVQLHVAGLGAAAHRGGHQRRHIVPLSGRYAGGQRLMGRHTGRNDQQLVQPQLRHGGTGHGHMSVVGRVEGPAEYADPHFAFTSCILRFSLLC